MYGSDASRITAAGGPVRLILRSWPPVRRWLYWTHRWLGVIGCLMFVMWLLSGLVMMYVGYPSLTAAERLAGLAPLRTGQARLSAADALARLPPEVREQAPRRIVLEMLADGAGGTAIPVWRILDAKGRAHAWSAVDGQPLRAFGAEQALWIARSFTGQSGGHVAETLQRDQWTVPQGLDLLRPLHRVEMGDAAGTELYVSSVSGEVVRDTTRHERVWNWLGAVPHWIYFTPLRADAPLWRDVVIWVSGICIVSAVTGLVIGVMRLRLRERYRNGRRTPYSGWMRWHHVAGLVGGVFVLTWVVSGWLSMDPNRWFQRAAPDSAGLARWHGPLDAAALKLAALQAPMPDARELELLSFDGRLLLQWRDGAGVSRVVDAATGAPLQLGEADIRAAAGRMKPGDAITGLQWLQQEDAHWYSHHNRRVTPVWRVSFADAAGTWLHVDPASGRILGTSTATSRVRRWLFNAPHSFDFPWLIRHRPAWDGVMWVLSAVGLVVSVSGVVLGWRRLRKGRPS
ncbi:PepSY domain-containing protein [Roseateles asaccharophilus]|uniref:Iron-regulated membrane protein n=1 Tax=Roseateles asaccharophilus TaxID=582607 RepID=A0ABU2ACP6_9BURK|nr:PepSY domain-containing protein [Roseateles asaccharophilus]MDR7334961.1 putative iron-regulated membrane protein [Roseateles asaccharophilus]